MSPEHVSYIKRKEESSFARQVESYLINRGVEVVRCNYDPTHGILTVILDDSVDRHWATTLLRGSRKLFKSPPGPIKVTIGSRYSTEI